MNSISSYFETLNDHSWGIFTLSSILSTRSLWDRVFFSFLSSLNFEKSSSFSQDSSQWFSFFPLVYLFLLSGFSYGGWKIYIRYQKYWETQNNTWFPRPFTRKLTLKEKIREYLLFEIGF